jgi:hypothetical protein
VHQEQRQERNQGRVNQEQREKRRK